MIKLNGKKITLDQLQAEMIAAGIDIKHGLALFGDFVYPNNETGKDIAGNSIVGPDIFVDEPKVQAVIDAHIPTRPLSDQELNVAFAEALEKDDRNAQTDILAQANGLKPRQRVKL